MSRGRARDRSGLALPAALVALFLLALVGAAGLQLARQEAVLSRIDHHLLRARLAAEAGARVATAALGSAPGELPPPGPTLWEGEIAPHARFQAGFRTLDAEHILVESVGRAGPGGRIRREVGRLLWRLDPDRRLAGMPATVIHGGDLTTADEATIVGGSPSGTGEEAEACAPYQERVTDAFAGDAPGPSARWDRTSEGTPHGPALGRWRAGALEARAEAIRLLPDGEAGFGEGDPPEEGSAAPDSPSTAEGSAPVYPFLVAPADLLLGAGLRVGIVRVRGDLDMEGAAQLRGIVFVEGDVRMRGASRIEGFLLADGDVHLHDQAELRASGCAFLEVLERTAGVRRPAPLPPMSWIPFPPR